MINWTSCSMSKEESSNSKEEYSSSNSKEQPSNSKEASSSNSKEEETSSNSKEEGDLIAWSQVRWTTKDLFNEEVHSEIALILIFFSLKLLATKKAHVYCITFLGLLCIPVFIFLSIT